MNEFRSFQTIEGESLANMLLRFDTLVTQLSTQGSRPSTMDLTISIMQGVPEYLKEKVINKALSFEYSDIRTAIEHIDLMQSAIMGC